MTIQAGQYVTDGTAVFILDDVRDGFRVGDIVFRPTLHDGFIKANGAQVKASDVQEIGAGLPNITGEAGYTDKNNFNGALYAGDSFPSTYGGHSIKFDASRSNPIYGASATVQPPALALIPQIKY